MSVLEIILYPTLAIAVLIYATVQTYQIVQMKRAEKGKLIYYDYYYTADKGQNEEKQKRKYEIDANVLIESENKEDVKKAKYMLAYLKVKKKNEKMD